MRKIYFHFDAGHSEGQTSQQPHSKPWDKTTEERKRFAGKTEFERIANLKANVCEPKIGRRGISSEQIGLDKYRLKYNVEKTEAGM